MEDPCWVVSTGWSGLQSCWKAFKTASLTPYAKISTENYYKKLENTFYFNATLKQIPDEQYQLNQLKMFWLQTYSGTIYARLESNYCMPFISIILHHWTNHHTESWTIVLSRVISKYPRLEQWRRKHFLSCLHSVNPRTFKVDWDTGDPEPGVDVLIVWRTESVAIWLVDWSFFRDARKKSHPYLRRQMANVTDAMPSRREGSSSARSLPYSLYHDFITSHDEGIAHHKPYARSEPRGKRDSLFLASSPASGG